MSFLQLCFWLLYKYRDFFLSLVLPELPTSNSIDEASFFTAIRLSSFLPLPILAKT